MTSQEAPDSASRSSPRSDGAAIVAALDAADMDFAGSDLAWGYGGGRDLSRFADDAT